MNDPYYWWQFLGRLAAWPAARGLMDETKTFQTGRMDPMSVERLLATLDPTDDERVARVIASEIEHAVFAHPQSEIRVLSYPLVLAALKHQRASATSSPGT